MAQDLCSVRMFPTRLEAEFAKQQLVAEGIPAFVTADDAGGMRPAPFAYTSGAELVVRQKDFERAAQLLKEWSL